MASCLLAIKSAKFEGSGRGKLASEPPPFLPEFEELLGLVELVLLEAVLAGIELLGTESTPPPFPETEVLLEAEILGSEAVPPFAKAVEP